MSGDDVQERLLALEREVFTPGGRVANLMTHYEYITGDPNGLSARMRRMELRAAIVTVLCIVGSFLAGLETARLWWGIR